MNHLGQKPLFLFLLLLLVGFISRIGPWGDTLFHLEYDYASLFSPAPIRQSPAFLEDTAVIYLDEESHQMLGQPYEAPWDRHLHAKLLHKLAAAGTRLVYFDIVFHGESSDPTADHALAGAIRDHGTVVLVGQLQRINTSLGFRERILPPYTPFAEAAKGWGLATFRDDSDHAIRTYPISTPGAPSSSQAAAEALIASGYPNSEYTSSSDKERHLVYYRGAPSLQQNTFRYHEVLNDSFDLTQLKDKIVFIGAAQSTGFSGTGKDTFLAPQSRIDGKDWNGVDFHIVSLENHLNGKAITRVSLVSELSTLALAAILATGIVLFPSKLSRYIYATVTLLLITTLGILFGEMTATTVPYLSLVLAQFPTLLAVVTLVQPKYKEVFISYSRELEKQNGFAKKLRNSLESTGLRCWLDTYDIKTGDDFRDAINQGIKGSRLYLLLVSEKVAQSREIVAEFYRADDAKIKKWRILMQPGFEHVFEADFGKENFIEYEKLSSEQQREDYARHIRKALRLSWLQLLLNKIQLRFRKPRTEHTLLENPDE